MNRKIWIGIAFIALVVIIGATSYAVRGTPDAPDTVYAPWVVRSIDTVGDVGLHVSMAIVPDTGTTYISYYDATNEDLKMATYVGPGAVLDVGTGINCGPDNAWWCETVDSEDDVGQLSSIAVSPTTKSPSIAYFDKTNSSLKLAVKHGVLGWSIVTIQDQSDVINGLGPSLAIDSTGKTHIAHYVFTFTGNDALWYVEYVGSGGNCSNDEYQCEVVDTGTGVGAFPSLALDSANRPHIAYQDAIYKALKYAYWNGSFWNIQEILPTESGYYTSFFIDKQNGDQKYIAHYDMSNATLEYAEYVGSEGNCGSNLWQCADIETVTAGSDPMGLSLAVDSEGYPFIAYQSSESALKVARPAAAAGELVGNCGPMQLLFSSWHCDTIISSDLNSRGDYISLAFNSSGVPYIAYYGNSTATDGDLRVAYRNPFQVYLPFTLED